MGNRNSSASVHQLKARKFNLKNKKKFKVKYSKMAEQANEEPKKKSWDMIVYDLFYPEKAALHKEAQEHLKKADEALERCNKALQEIDDKQKEYEENEPDRIAAAQEYDRKWERDHESWVQFCEEFKIRWDKYYALCHQYLKENPGIRPFSSVEGRKAFKIREEYWDKEIDRSMKYDKAKQRCDLAANEHCEMTDALNDDNMDESSKVELREKLLEVETAWNDSKNQLNECILRNNEEHAKDEQEKETRLLMCNTEYLEL